MHAYDREYGSKVHLWATFNEPNVMGFCGWIYGTFPPAKLAQFTTAGHHLLNLLRAHTAAYDAMKAQPGRLSSRQQAFSLELCTQIWIDMSLRAMYQAITVH